MRYLRVPDLNHSLPVFAHLEAHLFSLPHLPHHLSPCSLLVTSLPGRDACHQSSRRMLHALPVDSRCMKLPKSSQARPPGFPCWHPYWPTQSFSSHGSHLLSKRRNQHLCALLLSQHFSLFWRSEFSIIFIRNSVFSSQRYTICNSSQIGWLHLSLPCTCFKCRCSFLML